MVVSLTVCCHTICHVLQKYRICQHHRDVPSLWIDGHLVRFCQLVRLKTHMQTIATASVGADQQRSTNFEYCGKGGLAWKQMPLTWVSRAQQNIAATIKNRNMHSQRLTPFLTPTVACQWRLSLGHLNTMGLTALACKCHGSEAAGEYDASNMNLCCILPASHQSHHLCCATVEAFETSALC